MAAISTMLFLVSALMLIIPSSVSAVVVAPIQKDRTTRLYAVSVYLKTPLQPANLLLDLGASFSWVDCFKNYVSKTYRNIPCETALCTSALHSGVCVTLHDGPQAPGNSNNSCALIPENPIIHQTSVEDALVDSFALPTTTAGKLSVIPDFVMSCANTSLLKGFAKNVTGLAAFGRSNFSLSSQFSGNYPTPPLFAICLPSSDKAPGAAVFNTRGPYYFSTGMDLAKSLIYTPLLLNPMDFSAVGDNGYPSDEYFIGVTSIKVNGKPLTVKNQTQLLAIDANGYGGTRLSTVVPYTSLQTPIYKALIQAYTVESFALNLRLTIPPRPFGLCYNAETVPITTMGPAVPTVDLVMGREDVFWRMSGANLMVRVNNKKNNLWCLGIVDGGDKPRSAVVIGGLQLEDHLLQFDVKSNRLGFSSSLLAHGTSCAKFNFQG